MSRHHGRIALRSQLQNGTKKRLLIGAAKALNLKIKVIAPKCLAALQEGARLVGLAMAQRLGNRAGFAACEYQQALMMFA